MATEKVDILQVNTEPSRTSVKDLRKEMKSLKDQLLNLDEGTQVYNATLQKAAGIQHTLKEQMEEVNASAMDTGQILGNVTESLAGVSAAFQIGTSAMNLMGIESEASMKAIQQMQNVMALTQGLSQLDESGKAFKRLGNSIKSSALFNKLFTKTIVENTAATTANATAQVIGGKATDAGTKSVWKFNTALLANPIMWIVAGITAAVVAIGALILATNKVEYAQADFNAELEKTKRLQEDLEISQSEELQLMAARGATEREMMDQRIKDANTNLNNANALVDELTAIDGVRNEEQQKAFDEALANQKKYAADFRQVGIDSATLDIRTTVAANNKKADEIKRANEKASAERQKQIDDDKALVAATEEELKNKRQTDLQNALDDENEKYEKEKAAYERQNKNIEELTKQHKANIKKIEDDAAAEAKAKAAEVEAEALAKEQEAAAKRAEIAKQELDDSLTVMSDQYDEANLRQAEALDSGLINEATYNQNLRDLRDERLQDEINALEQAKLNKDLNAEQLAEIERQITSKQKEQVDQRLADKKAATDAEIALEQEKVDNALKIAGAMSGLISATADLAKEGSKEQKALQISSSIIDTIGGAISAYMTAQTIKPAPVGIIVGAINAATVLAAGFANIKKMKSINVGGDSGGGASIPSVSLAGLAASQAPVSNVQTVQGVSTEAAMQDTRVYVVESDITNTQRKVGTAEAEATF